MNNLKNKNQKVEEDNVSDIDSESSESEEYSEQETNRLKKDINLNLTFLKGLQDAEMEQACEELGIEYLDLTPKQIVKICNNKSYMLETKYYIKSTILKGPRKKWLLFENNEVEEYEESELNSYLGNIIYPALRKWYSENNTLRYQQVIEPGKPFRYGNSKDGFKINSFKNLMHTYTKGKVFDDETKANGQIFLNYILDVLCSGNKKHAEFIENWIGNMCRHGKNDVAIYLKSVQGTGKSTLSEYLTKNIIGREASITTGSYPIVSGFDSTLKGKTLVSFEELESFSPIEWKAISSKLKMMVTGDMWQYNGKGKDPISLSNFSNYIIMSNDDAIKDADGRRYFICDISIKYKGLTEYWNTLYDKSTVWNSKTGEYLFHYFIDRCPEKWKAQDHMPETESKKDIHSRLLHPVYQYLKDCFINEGEDLKMTLTDLHNGYLDKQINDKKPMGVQLFNGKLKDVGIICKRGHAGALKFNYSVDELKQIAKREKWYSDYDYDESGKIDNLGINESTDISKVSELSESIDRKAIIKLTEERDNLLEKVKELTKLLESNNNKKVMVNKKVTRNIKTIKY
jgi:hypothetical protein